MNASAKQVAVVRAKLKFANREEFLQGFAPLLSPAGLFVRTKNSKTEGTPVRFEFRLADDTPIFVGEGVVRKQIPFDAARPKRPCGMLVGLRKLNRQSKDILDEVLRRKAEARSTRPVVGQSVSAEDVPDLTDMATPPAPVPAADQPSPVAAPPRRISTPFLQPSEAPAAPDMATPPAPVEALGMATQDQMPSQDLIDEVGAGASAAATADEGLFGGEKGLFDGLDEGIDLFGEGGLDDELDNLFASAGMVSSGSLDFEGPADLAGSAIPLFNVAAADSALAESGGGLLSFNDDELEDEEDFFDMGQSKPAPTAAAAPTFAEEEPEPAFAVPSFEEPSEPFFQESPVEAPSFAEPSFAEPAALSFAEPSFGEPAEPSFEEPSFVAPSEPSFEEPSFVAPSEPSFEEPSFAAPSDPYFGEPAEPSFGEPALSEPEPSYAEPVAHAAPAADAGVEFFGDFGGGAEAAQAGEAEELEAEPELVEETEPEPVRPRVSLPPRMAPPTLPPPPRLAPPPSAELGQVLSHLSDDEPVTPREESGLIRTPSILSEPAINVAAMAAKADDAALSTLVGRGEASRLPAPPSGVNPLDSVSIANAELPPPPKPTGFSSPTLDALEGAKGKKKGLFNKLFGKE